MKTYFTIFLILFFCGIHALVTIMIGSHTFPKWQISLMTHVPVTLFYGAICLLERGYNSIHDKQFQNVGKLIIFIFLLMYCLNSAGIVSGVTNKLFWFYGINLAGLLMILISSYRHGNFKD